MKLAVNVQFAVPRKSTTQALVYIFHLIHAGLDIGHCYARLFMADFRKASLVIMFSS